jgi:hypothetical protein
MTVRIVREEAAARVEVCDHSGSTEEHVGVSHCRACGKVWPTRFGVGAPTTRIVPKETDGTVTSPG